jgi:hypothetical protein
MRRLEDRHWNGRRNIVSQVTQTDKSEQVGSAQQQSQQRQSVRATDNGAVSCRASDEAKYMSVSCQHRTYHVVLSVRRLRAITLRDYGHCAPLLIQAWTNAPADSDFPERVRDLVRDSTPKLPDRLWRYAPATSLDRARRCGWYLSIGDRCPRRFCLPKPSIVARDPSVDGLECSDKWRPHAT